MASFMPQVRKTGWHVESKSQKNGIYKIIFSLNYLYNEVKNETV